MASYIGRRKFLASLGGAAAAWPLATRAQQTGVLPIIGVLGTVSAAWHPWIAAFLQRLHELGWNAALSQSSIGGRKVAQNAPPRLRPSSFA
jgi:hypothetical protein